MLRKMLTVLICFSLMITSLVLAQDNKTKYPGRVSLKLSGPGVIDASTVKVGERFSVDLYFSNDTIRRGFSVGFEISSPDIKKVIHVADSNNTFSEFTDIKAYNGWHNKSVFDLTGVFASNNDWDGNLPDTCGFVGIVIKKRYLPHPETKQISWALKIPTPGTITIDSTFFPPGGTWMYDNEELPEWGGPYTIKVVE